MAEHHPSDADGESDYGAFEESRHSRRPPKTTRHRQSYFGDDEEEEGSITSASGNGVGGAASKGAGNGKGGKASANAGGGGGGEGGGGAGASMNQSSPRWMPPAADRQEHSNSFVKFGESFGGHFFVPPRLEDKSLELIETANDFHYAMINDLPRNQFYFDALSMCITTDSVVVEIGTGSGLLAMIACKVGARHVTAIEANRHLAEIARMNIRKNGMSDRITVLNALSTDVTSEDLPYGKADVLVSEILGTLLLGESALEYIPDARERLCKPQCHIIPAKGRQCVQLVECDAICSITSARNWNGIKLESFNGLQDTASLVFTKQYGFRLSSVPFTALTKRNVLLDIDFYSGQYDDVPVYQKLPLVVEHSGVAHAAIFSWEVFSDAGERYKMTTHVEDTLDNFPRDMQWGQGVQLLEDYTKIESATPTRLRLEAGAPYLLVVNQAEGGSALQVLVQTSADDVEVVGAEEAAAGDAE